jgi:hypothetical protein
MTRSPRQFRYQAPVIPLQAEKIIDVEAKDVTVSGESVIAEAAGRGRAEEALAVANDLWADLAALEDTEKKLRRKRTSVTDAVLVTGQIMAIKAALGRHLQRHRTKKGD